MKKLIAIAFIVTALFLSGYGLMAQTEHQTPTVTTYMGEDSQLHYYADAQLPQGESAASEGATLDEDTPVIEPQSPDFWAQAWDWIKVNWGEFLVGLLLIIEVIVKLTPTEKDNAWFLWLRALIDKFLPNRKSGGGVHPTT